MTPHATPYAGRTIVMTGAAGGIGAELVLQQLAQGARILAIDVDTPGLAALAARVARELGDEAASRLVPFTSALASPDEAREALAQVEGPLYALVHLAGIFVPNELDDASLPIWQKVMAANVDNAWALTLAAADRFDPSTACRIVFTSSLAFRRGAPEHPAYGTAKGALAGLTRALSRRLAPKVLVNAVAPGIIATKMTDDIVARRGDRLLSTIPLHRLGHPAEVADVIDWLCGPRSTYVTGQIINVDGGVVNS